MPPLLPGARCALTAPFHPCLCPEGPSAVYSLLHFPSPRDARPLAGTVPCGARTFLAKPRSLALRATLTRLPNCQTMPRRGLEPPRRFRHQILSLACLPISAPGQPTDTSSAPERTRTSTGLRPLDPESSASTNSATGATGAPGEIRTPGLLIRSQTLYPAELRAHEPTHLLGRQ